MGADSLNKETVVYGFIDKHAQLFLTLANKQLNSKPIPLCPVHFSDATGPPPYQLACLGQWPLVGSGTCNWEQMRCEQLKGVIWCSKLHKNRVTE